MLGKEAFAVCIEAGAGELVGCPASGSVHMGHTGREISDNRLLGRLGTEDLALLMPHLELVRLDRGDTLIEPDRCIVSDEMRN